MRKHVILLNEDSAKYPNAKRGQFNSSTFRGTWRKPMHTDKLNAHAYRRRPLVYSVHILSTAKFPERFRINSKRYYFNPQKFGIRLALGLASFRNKGNTYFSNAKTQESLFFCASLKKMFARPLVVHCSKLDNKACSDYVARETNSFVTINFNCNDANAC